MPAQTEIKRAKGMKLSALNQLHLELESVKLSIRKCPSIRKWSNTWFLIPDLSNTLIHQPYIQKSASLKFSAIFVYIPASRTLSLTSAQKQQQYLDNIQLRTTPHNSNSCGRSLSEFNMNTWCQLYINQTIYSLSRFLSWLLSRDRNN